eukprot:1161716-Pelagomonas_calceolata.AAC.3
MGSPNPDNCRNAGTILQHCCTVALLNGERFLSPRKHVRSTLDWILGSRRYPKQIAHEPKPFNDCEEFQDASGNCRLNDSIIILEDAAGYEDQLESSSFDALMVILANAAK